MKIWFRKFRRRLKSLGMTYHCLKLVMLFILFYLFFLITLGSKSFVDVLGSLAWPMAFVSVAYIFKRQLTFLMSRISSFRGLGVELDLIDHAYWLSKEEDAVQVLEDEASRHKNEPIESTEPTETKQPQSTSDAREESRSQKQDESFVGSDEDTNLHKREAIKEREKSYPNKKRKKVNVSPHPSIPDDILELEDIKNDFIAHEYKKNLLSKYHGSLYEDGLLNLGDDYNNKEEVALYVLKSWIRLETIIREVYDKKFPNHKDDNFLVIISVLKNEDVITEQEFRILSMLRKVRNQVSHGHSSNLDFYHAEKYEKAISNIAYRLLNHLKNEELSKNN